MSTKRKQFIQSLFSSLQLSEYILLKFIEPTIDEIDPNSDIDLFIPSKNISSITQLVEANENVAHFTSSQQSFMTQLFIYFVDNSFLQIDCLFELSRKDLIYLSHQEIKQERKFSNGIVTYSESCLLEHLVYFNFLNYSGVPQKYINFFLSLSTVEQHNILDHFNATFKTSISSFQEFDTYTVDIRQKLKTVLLQKEYNKGLKRLKRKVTYYRDTLSNLKKQRGKLITFSGVDGAGKSTILNETKEILTKQFRKKVVILRHRPSILPIISAWRYGKKGAEQRSISRLPRQGKNNSSVLSILRFFYYFLDYLFGQVYIFCKYQLRNYTVLYDRYYFDFIVDGKRSNIQLPKAIPLFLYRFINKAELNIFLFAKPSVILERKKELSAEDITTLTNDYQNLFQQFSQQSDAIYLPIENINKTKTINTIISEISQIN